MAVTVFTNDSTVVTSNWLNAAYGPNGHNHRGLSDDGSAPKIGLDEIDTDLLNVMNEILAVRPQLADLFSGIRIKVPLFGGLGVDGAFTGTTNLTRSLYEFTSFTISQGQTVRCYGGVTRIKVQGDCTIAGLLLAQPIQPGGIGKGWYNTGGNGYGIGADPMGSCGSESVDHGDVSGLKVLRDRGGLGGGCLIIECLGTVLINGSIGANGGNGSQATILSGTPSVGGSGGGSGGSIIIQSYTRVQLNGTVDANGGNGAPGQNTDAAGGGGGSGGWIWVKAPEINDAGNTYSVNGGLPGTTYGSGARQGGGGGGFGGTGGNHKTTGSEGQLIKQTLANFTPL
jgi:hypothetical protein